MAAVRVLVVDDDAAIVTTVSRMLARHGYDVVGAHGPSQALQIVGDACPFDVVVSDMQMPGMQG